MQHIYILEDNKDIGYILEILLADEGYAVEIFPNIKSIKLRLAGKLPDLFLLDIMLPDGNGDALCRELKHDPQSRHIPVMLMSAQNCPEGMKSPSANEGFIAKPFDLNEVTQSVHHILRSA